MPEFAIHNIHSRKDINKMQQSLLNEPAEKVYVAMELAENMVDAGEEGEILINGSQVVNVVHNKSKLTEVREAVEQARFYKENCISGRIGEKKNNSNLGGRGLLSILYSGWSLEIEESTTDYKITASKCTA